MEVQCHYLLLVSLEEPFLEFVQPVFFFFSTGPGAATYLCWQQVSIFMLSKIHFLLTRKFTIWKNFQFTSIYKRRHPSQKHVLSNQFFAFFIIIKERQFNESLESSFLNEDPDLTTEHFESYQASRAWLPVLTRAVKTLECQQSPL